MYQFDGTIHTHGFHGALFPRATPAASVLTAEDLYAVYLVNWAAECVTHAKRTGLPLGNLPHSLDEIDEARATVARLFGRPPQHEDNGVKVRSKRI